MSRNFEREVEDILDEEPVIVQSISISENGIQIDFMDQDEQSGNLLRQQSWLFAIDSDNTLELFQLLQDGGRNLIRDARVSSRGDYYGNPEVEPESDDGE